MDANGKHTVVSSTLDEYLRKRLKPVEGAIPHLNGIEMYGNSIPAANADGDLFEYINFQQRYNIDARIERAKRLSKEYLEPPSEGLPPQNLVDVHLQWLKSRPEYAPDDANQYRKSKSSEQLRIAENLHELYTTAGVLLVDAQGHGSIAAKIASTVHDTFHTAMLCELDLNGKTTAEVFEIINLRLAQSVTARNALGFNAEESSREIATMIYGEVRPDGLFRFVNFGHPPPLVFSAEFGKFMDIGWNRMVQFPSLGLEIPEDHPDRTRYVSLMLRPSQIMPSDLDQITLMSPGDIIFLYTDGVYDGDEVERQQIERIIQELKQKSAKDICGAILDYALLNDEHFRQTGEADRIYDKTVFIIKKK